MGGKAYVRVERNLNLKQDFYYRLFVRLTDRNSKTGTQ